MRPSDYNLLLAKDICDKIIDGQSLRSICQLDGMPCMSTVFLWLADGKHPQFSDMYREAKKLQADALMEDALAIADDSIRDTIIGKNGDEIINGEWVARSRLRVETRMKIAAKLEPRKYGDKQLVQSENINHNLNTEIPLSEADMAILSRFGFSDNS